mgnify:CR=1 FL=1
MIIWYDYYCNKGLRVGSKISQVFPISQVFLIGVKETRRLKKKHVAVTFCLQNVQCF